MLFLGIDLGWSNGASGLAALRLVDGALHLIALDLALDHETVLRWIDTQAAGSPALIAIDAPTIIRNAAGQRACERQLNAAYRKFGLGCHPANLGRPFAPKTSQFARTLEAMNFRHGPDITPRQPGRYQIEVFPHATIVRLFELDYRLLYKKGSVSERLAGLRKLRRLIGTLKSADPPCVLPALPRIPLSGGTARKHVEDRLDAILCAWTAAHYWLWGRERNEVFGDAETGFIVVPTTIPAATRTALPGIRLSAAS